MATQKKYQKEVTACDSKHVAARIGTCLLMFGTEIHIYAYQTYNQRYKLWMCVKFWGGFKKNTEKWRRELLDITVIKSDIFNYFINKNKLFTA